MALPVVRMAAAAPYYGRRHFQLLSIQHQHHNYFVLTPLSTNNNNAALGNHRHCLVPRAGSRRCKSTIPSLPSSPHHAGSSSTLPDLDTLISSTLRDPNTSVVPDVGPRPQTKWERVQNFPKGVVALIKDCLQYKSIHDASKTPLNAWTINSPLVRNNKQQGGDSCRGFFIYEDEIRPGRIPRRQYEQQRQLQQDFRTMLPLVLLWIPPIVGFVPPIMAMVAPRQTMSRQFHNPYEIMWFNQIEYEQRKESFMKLGNLFWSSIPLVNVRKVVVQQYLDDEKDRPHDAAGPVLDGMVLYSAFCTTSPPSSSHHDEGPPPSSPPSLDLDDTSDKTSSSSSSPPPPVQSTSSSSASSGRGYQWLDLPHGIFTTVQDLPREYLVQLALCIGVCQHLPLWWSQWMVELTPSFLLHRQVDRIGKIVTHDDALLLEEGHDLNGCTSLTDQEVTDACLLRALPVQNDHSPSMRRECLTNHLKMVANVKRHMHGPITDGFRLFTLHLAPLRYHLKMLHQEAKKV
jgi:hypothetical protein